MNSVEILIKVMAAAAQPFMCSCNIRLCMQSGLKVTSQSMLNKRQAAHTTLLQICETGRASVLETIRKRVSVEGRHSELFKCSTSVSYQ